MPLIDLIGKALNIRTVYHKVIAGNIANVDTPGFKEKDLVEDYLHNEACDGSLPLAAAQKQIAVDWLAVYQTLSPETLAALKAQYHSWAD